MFEFHIYDSIELVIPGNNSRRLQQKMNPDLSEEVVGLRANAFCIGICVILGILSGVIPCIDSIPLQTLSILIVCMYRS